LLLGHGGWWLPPHVKEKEKKDPNKKKLSLLKDILALFILLKFYIEYLTKQPCKSLSTIHLGTIVGKKKKKE